MPIELTEEDERTLSHFGEFPFIPLYQFPGYKPFLASRQIGEVGVEYANGLDRRGRMTNRPAGLAVPPDVPSGISKFRWTRRRGRPADEITRNGHA